jgi:hypothetical protein
MKKYFLILLVIVVAIFSSIGCTRGYPKMKSYQEKIISFYVAQERDTLVLIGEEYHYVFKKLTSKVSDFLKAEKLLGYSVNDLDISLTKDINETIDIQFHLEFPINRLNSEQVAWLDTHGFYRIERKDGTSAERYSGGLFFDGKRFNKENLVNIMAVKIENKLTIKVIELDTDNSDLNATPLVVEDNVIKIKDIILEPIFVKRGQE